jgi:hypothetical protein
MNKFSRFADRFVKSHWVLVAFIAVIASLGFRQPTNGGNANFDVAYYGNVSEVATAGTYTLATYQNSNSVPTLLQGIAFRQSSTAGAGFTSIQLKTSDGLAITNAIPLSSFSANAEITINIINGQVLIWPGESIVAVVVGNGTNGSGGMMVQSIEPSGGGSWQ